MTTDKLEHCSIEEIREANRALLEMYPHIQNWSGEEIATQCRYTREAKKCQQQTRENKQMTTITKYITADGKEFGNEEAAYEWEKVLTLSQFLQNHSNLHFGVGNASSHSDDIALALLERFTFYRENKQMTGFLFTTDTDGHSVLVAVDKITAVHQGSVPKGKLEYNPKVTVITCGNLSINSGEEFEVIRKKLSNFFP